MNKKALTLTVVANMTSNYSEGLGNVASVQKVFKNRRIYSMRSRESLKNAIMIQSGWYDDLETTLKVLDAAQKTGVKMITSCKDLLSVGTAEEVVKAMMNHPALYAYHLKDEPEVNDLPGLGELVKSRHSPFLQPVSATFAARSVRFMTTSRLSAPSERVYAITRGF